MRDLSNLSDDELLAATADQPEAFGVFYERHVRAVLGYLARGTSDRDVALDLTAEVFAAALTASGRYVPGQAPAAAWLLGIARNKLLASRRRHARSDKARRKLGIPRLSFTDAALERVEEIIDAERTNHFGALARLDADERDAITARVIEERDYGEIAAAAGVSPAAVRQRVSRGLAKLQRRAEENR